MARMFLARYVKRVLSPISPRCLVDLESAKTSQLHFWLHFADPLTYIRSAMPAELVRFVCLNALVYSAAQCLEIDR